MLRIYTRELQIIDIHLKQEKIIHILKNEIIYLVTKVFNNVDYIGGTFRNDCGCT